MEQENNMLKIALKKKKKFAENDICKHCDEAKAQKAKLANEISKLKSEISSLKLKSCDAAKMIKSYEKMSII